MKRKLRLEVLKVYNKVGIQYVSYYPSVERRANAFRFLRTGRYKFIDVMPLESELNVVKEIKGGSYSYRKYKKIFGHH